MTVPRGTPSKPLAGVDVAQVNDRLAALGGHSVGNDRRTLLLPERNGFEQHVARQFLDQRQVVEHVDQVDAPQ